MNLRSNPVFLLRIPPSAASIHYRAYAQPLASGTVLAWILSRFRRAFHPAIRLVCVCERREESERLQTTPGFRNDVDVLCATGPGEASHCRQAMDWYRVNTVIVGRFGHAIVPSNVVRDVLQIHKALQSDLTDIAVPGGVPCFVVESSMVDRLMASTLPDLSQDVVTGAEMLRKARTRDPRLAEHFVWTHLSAELMGGINATRWPENLAFETARDVDVLREALATTTTQAHEDETLVDRLKRASIAVRDRNSRDEHVMPRRNSAGVSPRIRVLYLTGISEFVGASQSLCHLIDGLDRARFEPIALVPYAGTFVEELRRRDVNVLCPNKGSGKPTFENLQFARSLLRDVAPSIVHSNHDMGMPTMNATVLMGLPIVQHVRIQIPRQLAPQIAAADAVIAVSEFVRQRVLELDIDPRKIDVILNGVNVAEFRPAPQRAIAARAALGISSEEFVVVVIARFAPYKCHDTVIAAVGQLRDSLGRGHLLLVGDLHGDRRYRHQIQSWIEKAGLTNHMTQITFTADVPSVLHGVDALALMSKDEALGRVVLEAMAVGRPVVVSDTGGPQEVIEDGRNGFVVRHNDARAVAAVLRSLALSPNLAQQVGRAAVETIRSSFTSTHCADKTMDVYQRVLAGRRQTAQGRGASAPR